MATNTTFNPKTLNEFTKDHLEFAGQSIYFEASPSATTEQDFVFVDDMLMTGGELLVENGSIEDQVFVQIVHPIYGVVKEFVTAYRVAADSIRQISLQIQYPSKLQAGLSVRCRYVASSGLVRKVALNLFLHRILE